MITNIFKDTDLLATSFGFMASVFKNIIPIMICHTGVNITSVFMPENLSPSFQYIGAIAMTVITSGYGFYLIKRYNTQE